MDSRISEGAKEEIFDPKNISHILLNDEVIRSTHAAIDPDCFIVLTNHRILFIYDHLFLHSWYSISYHNVTKVHVTNNQRFPEIRFQVLGVPQELTFKFYQFQSICELSRKLAKYML